MTVVVAVAAPDGIILAADSRMTIEWDGGRHRVVSDTAQKVFPVGNIGVATYGSAFIGSRTIAGLMDEFVSQLPEGTAETADTMATSLGTFFHERFMADSAPETLAWCEQNPGVYPIGFLIAGYDEEGIGSVREVGLPGPYVGDSEIDTGMLGVNWRGQTDVIRRLIKGFDGDQFATLGHDVPEALSDPIASLEYSLLLPVTMQDAVDLASFLIRTTVDMQRFSDGVFGAQGSVPGCGGPIRLLSITRSGAEWVTPPTLTTDGSERAERVGEAV